MSERRPAVARHPPPARARRSGSRPATSSGLTAIILAESKRYRRIFGATRRRTSVANVHELRAATRRLFAALTFAAAIHPAARKLKLTSALQEPFDAAGKLRDLQVMKRTVRMYCEHHPEAGGLYEHVRRRLTKQRARLARRLHRARPKRIVRELRGLAAAIELRSAALPARRSERRHVVRELTRSRGSMLRQSRAVRAADAASLHRARLGIKSLRYQLELAAPFNPPSAKPDLQRLRRLQAALGSINDHSTLLRAIDEFMDRHPDSAPLILPYRGRVERERRRLILRYLPELAEPERLRSKAASR